MAKWITEAPRPPLSQVNFTKESLDQLQQMLPSLRFYDSFEEIKRAIEAVLITDPRSIFIRKNLGEDTYGFCIDILNVLCKFGNENDVTVFGFEDWSHKQPKRGVPNLLLAVIYSHDYITYQSLSKKYSGIFCFFRKRLMM